MRVPVFWVFGVIFGLVPMHARPVQQKTAATPIVITHVTVINPGTSSVLPNRTVVIIGDRIASFSDAATFQTPKNARVIDATGKFLIPGLWDMHVHSAFGDWFPGGRDIILPLFIANGVIGVRDMGGDLPVLLQWRKEIADGRIIGPRMVISGPMLDGYLPDGKLRFPNFGPNREPLPEGELRFITHVEERYDADPNAYAGMEIVNRHTDAVLDRSAQEYLVGAAPDLLGVALDELISLLAVHPFVHQGEEDA